MAFDTGTIALNVIALSDSGDGISSVQIIMLILAVVGLTAVMLSTRRRIIESRSRSTPSARERYGLLQEEAKATRDVEQVMLELDKLSRQIHGRIDTRLARLEALIRDADQRIARLSRLGGGRLPLGSSGGSGPSFQSATGGSPVEVTRAEGIHREPVSDHSADNDDRYAAVYRLADGGMSALQIAQQTGRTPGEVELLLALRKTKQEAQQATTPLEQ